MKVLHLSSEKSWRGGEQQIAYLIEELEKLGVENYVACRRKSAFEEYCKKKEISYVSLPFLNQYDLYTAYEIKNICNHLSIDIMHLHSSHSHGTGIISAILGNSTPIVLSRRVDFPLKNNFWSRYKYNHPAIKKIICVSEAIKEIVKNSIRKPKKCITIYSGIDLSKFEGKRNKGILRSELNIPSENIIIGNISAIAPHKDYFTFVNTAEIIIKNKKLKATFLIIGDGPERTVIETYIKEKGLSEHILLTGFRKDIPEIFPELDIFLITSKTEGLGTTVLDAFASKVAVVATEAGGIKELVINGETGLTAQTGDYVKLAENIEIIINSRELRNRYTDNAYWKVQKFSKVATANSTFEVYKGIKNKASL